MALETAVVLDHHAPSEDGGEVLASQEATGAGLGGAGLFRCAKLTAELGQHGLLGLVQSAHTGASVLGEQAVGLLLLEVALHGRDAVVWRAGLGAGYGIIDSRLEEHGTRVVGKDGGGDDGHRSIRAQVFRFQRRLGIRTGRFLVLGWGRAGTGIIIVVVVAAVLSAATTRSLLLELGAEARACFLRRRDGNVKGELRHAAYYLSILISEAIATEVNVHELAASGRHGRAGTR